MKCRLAWIGAVTVLLMLGATACTEVSSEIIPLPASSPTAVVTRATVQPDATATRFSLVTPVVSGEPVGDAAPGDPPPAEIIATAEALFGEGGVYVASLPRPGDVPVDWLMDRAPRFEQRDPQPGSTYRFACEDLPARSTGVASVGYRNLEGLPSVSVEYVIYPTAADATAALEDMRRAVTNCAAFDVSVGDNVQAQMTIIPYADFGMESFAAALRTQSAATGDLLTHVIKIRQDNVVIGINYALREADGPPDSAVSETLSRLAVSYVSQVE